MIIRDRQLEVIVRVNRASSFFLAAIISIGFSTAAWADKPAADATTQAAPTDDALNKQKTIEGRIQDVAVTLETGIKDLSKSLHHMKRSAFDIFVEVQRSNMVVVGEPDVIGPIVIPAMPNPSGMISMGGFQPPRKKFLDYFMSQIDDLMKMTQTEVTALVLPDDANDEAKAEMKTLSDTLATLPKDIDALKEVTQGPDYDNMAIARAAQQLQNDVVIMEKASKKLNSEAKKEESRAKKGVRDADNALKKEQKGE